MGQTSASTLNITHKGIGADRSRSAGRLDRVREGEDGGGGVGEEYMVCTPGTGGA